MHPPDAVIINGRIESYLYGMRRREDRLWVGGVKAGECPQFMRSCSLKTIDNRLSFIVTEIVRFSPTRQTLRAPSANRER